MLAYIACVCQMSIFEPSGSLFVCAVVVTKICFAVAKQQKPSLLVFTCVSHKEQRQRRCSALDFEVVQLVSFAIGNIKRDMLVPASYSNMIPGRT